MCLREEEELDSSEMDMSERCVAELVEEGEDDCCSSPESREESGVSCSRSACQWSLKRGVGGSISVRCGL